MPEQWKHHSRKVTIWLRRQPLGGFCASVDSEDLFVPEGAEPGDPEWAGKTFDLQHQRFGNDVAVADCVLASAVAVAKGIAPKEVETDG